MSIPMNHRITLELQSANQRPRVFEFELPLIRLGSSQGMDVFLDSAGTAAMEFLIRAASKDRLAYLEPARGLERYELNGAPRFGACVLEVGDILQIGTHRITVRDLRDLDSAGSGPSADTEQPDSSPAPMPRHAPSSRAGLPGTTPHPSAAPPSAVSRATRTPVNAVPKAATPPGNDDPPPVSSGSSSDISRDSHLFLFFEPVRTYLQDDQVSEILINGPTRIFVERKGKLEATRARFASEHALEAAVMNVARSIGRLFDRDHPRLDARLPDGSRVHAVLPPLSREGTTVAIRKFSREKLTIPKLIEFGSLSEVAARLLQIIVELGRNLIVSGATSSGKTSILNVLSSMIPVDQRILVLEDASELQLQQSHTVSFETRKPDEFGKGEVSMRDLLHSSLRLRPDRLVIGEIRGAEAMDLLQAMNTGHDGTMSTIHANSPIDALVRLESCAMYASTGFPLSALRAQVASAVQIVVQTARLHDGSRKVTHISEVGPLRNGDYTCTDILRFDEAHAGFDQPVQGVHQLTGFVPEFLRTAHRRGMDLKGLLPGPDINPSPLEPR
jgi:pilus assembly protein CpaF